MVSGSPSWKEEWQEGRIRCQAHSQYTFTAINSWKIDLPKSVTFSSWPSPHDRVLLNPNTPPKAREAQASESDESRVLEHPAGASRRGALAWILYKELTHAGKLTPACWGVTTAKPWSLPLLFLVWVLFKHQDTALDGSAGPKMGQWICAESGCRRMALLELHLQFRYWREGRPSPEPTPTPTHAHTRAVLSLL